MEKNVYTLSGLVSRLRRAFGVPVGPSLPRSVRYWANEGLLQPRGAVHTGKGRNRTFGADELLRAAILLECTKWNITVGSMEKLFEEIEKKAPKRQNRLGLIEMVKLSPEPYLQFTFRGWPPECQMITDRLIPTDSRSVLRIHAKQLVADLEL
jgi:DNA-binding transcriptional MerR regulator